MPNNINLTASPARPWRLLLLALMTAFVSELAIMKILPYILPAGWSDTLEAIIDSCLLTTAVAPVLWFLAVRPIQRLAQSRMYFLSRALTSQEEERRRITLELHDGIGQSLTSLMLGLRAMEETTTDITIRERIQALRKVGATIHEDLRRIVRGLRPAILDQAGLVAAVERLLEDIRQTGVRQVDFETAGLSSLRLNTDLETTAFRIVQEAIANSVKHSDSSHLRVLLAAKDNELLLRIADNGKGFDALSVLNCENGTYGLLSIRERAMISGGRVEIQTSPNVGTVVSAHLPLLMRTETNA